MRKGRTASQSHETHFRHPSRSHHHRHVLCRKCRRSITGPLLAHPLHVLHGRSHAGLHCACSLWNEQLEAKVSKHAHDTQNRDCLVGRLCQGVLRPPTSGVFHRTGHIIHQPHLQKVPDTMREGNIGGREAIPLHWSLCSAIEIHAQLEVVFCPSQAALSRILLLYLPGRSVESCLPIFILVEQCVEPVSIGGYRRHILLCRAYNVFAATSPGRASVPSWWRCPYEHCGERLWRGAYCLLACMRLHGPRMLLHQAQCYLRPAEGLWRMHGQQKRRHSQNCGREQYNH